MLEGVKVFSSFDDRVLVTFVNVSTVPVDHLLRVLQKKENMPSKPDSVPLLLDLVWLSQDHPVLEALGMCTRNLGANGHIGKLLRMWMLHFARKQAKPVNSAEVREWWISWSH